MKTFTLPSCLAVPSVVLVAGLAACAPPAVTPDAGPAAPPGPVAQCTGPHEVACVDQQIQELQLFQNISTGDITNTPEGEGFQVLIDATAGGLSPNESFVYARFEDDGLVKVDVSDLDAFDSLDWDIAFRRFVIRINSGVSGPSCVTEARVGSADDFDGITKVPADIPDDEYLSEAYFQGDTCTFVADGSGLGTSPGTALSTFWEYPGSCVQMTYNSYIVRRQDGRSVKLQVTHYYSDSVQTYCNENGSTPAGATGSGNVQLRYSFIDP